MVKMSEKFQRPYDLLQKVKDKKVLIELEDGLKISGILESFDIHLNLTLRDVVINEKVSLPSLFLRSFKGVISV